MGREALDLPWCTASLGVQHLLGLKTFKETLYTAQLKFLVRLQNQGSERWSRDAYLAHIHGNWRSPFLENVQKIKREVGMLRGPVSTNHVDMVIKNHFLRQLNNGISDMDLPALKEVSARRRARHVNDTVESKVGSNECNIRCLLTFG